MHKKFMSFEDYEESGYNGLGMDFLIITYKSCVLYPRRSGLVGRSNHLRPTYLYVPQNGFTWALGYIGQNFKLPLNENWFL